MEGRSVDSQVKCLHQVFRHKIVGSGYVTKYGCERCITDDMNKQCPEYCPVSMYSFYVVGKEE